MASPPRAGNNKPSKMLASYFPAPSPALPFSSPAEKALAVRLLRDRNSCRSSNCLRRSSHPRRPLLHRARPSVSTRAMAGQGTSGGDERPMKLLFVEMGVGYDQHGQDITAAAMRACRDAISSNSIPAFRRGSIPGVTPEHMKLQIKLGVPRETQQFLDVERVKSVFPYGKIINIEVVDGGLVCSSGVYLEAMGDKNEDCYVVNAAVYVGY